jgi:hypothetical protein
MTDGRRVYLVQILASVEVEAKDAQEATDMALDELARRCESARKLFIHVEEL